MLKIHYGSGYISALAVPRPERRSARIDSFLRIKNSVETFDQHDLALECINAGVHDRAAIGRDVKARVEIVSELPMEATIFTGWIYAVAVTAVAN